MSGSTPLFQIHTDQGSITLVDSRVRKNFSQINIHLGFTPSFFTFHDFSQAGATFAYGTWSSDCVWGYIQSDHTSGENLADALKNL